MIISDIDVINTCHDKYATYRFLCEHNINTPKTYIGLDEVYQVIANKEMAFPLIIKPRWGNGSLSIYEADDEKELAFFYKIVKKEIMKSYLVDQSKKDLEHCVIMQEKLIGQEYGLDVINDLTGKYIKTIVKQKIAMRSGETDCAKIISDKRFDYLGEKLSLLLRHMTNLDVDAFIIDGQPYVLELNPRFGGDILLVI